MLGGDFWFLFLNASVVWLVMAIVLMKLFRLKALVVILIITPFVIGSTFRNSAGVPELIGFYGTSILYGMLGLISGIVYMEYEKAKRKFQKASKISFLARGGIALSSFYLVTHFIQKIIFANKTVVLALNFIHGGDKAKDILSQFNDDGAVVAGVVIAASVLVLVAQHYLTNKTPSSTSETPITGAILHEES